MLVALGWVLGKWSEQHINTGGYEYYPPYYYSQSDDSNRLTAYATIAAVFVALGGVVVSVLQFMALRVANEASKKAFEASINAERGYLQMRSVSVRIDVATDFPVPIRGQTNFILENVGRTQIVVRFISPAASFNRPGLNPVNDRLIDAIRAVQWSNQMSQIIAPGGQLGTNSRGPGEVAFPASQWTADHLQKWSSEGMEYVFLVVIGYETIHGQRRRFASTAVLRRGARDMEIPLGLGNPFDEPEP